MGLKRKALAANAQANARSRNTRAINTATMQTIFVDVTGMVEIVVVAKTTTIFVIKKKVASSTAVIAARKHSRRQLTKNTAKSVSAWIRRANKHVFVDTKFFFGDLF